MTDPFGLQIHQYQDEENDDEARHDWPSGGETEPEGDDE